MPRSTATAHGRVSRRPWRDMRRLLWRPLRRLSDVAGRASPQPPALVADLVRVPEMGSGQEGGSEELWAALARRCEARCSKDFHGNRELFAPLGRVSRPYRAL